MINRRNRITALLLSFMMIALNLFSGTEALYAYAETDADSQTITEETADTEQAEDTADAEEEEQAETPEEEAAPAADAQEETEEFEASETVDGVTVTVEGIFPEEAESLSVKKLSGDKEVSVEKAIDKIAGEAEVKEQYNFDIAILDKDGEELEPIGDAKVSFETEEIANDAFETEVFHIEGGEAEKLNVETKGEVATIETDSFSPYSVRLIYNNFDSETPQAKELDLIVGRAYSVNSILADLEINKTAKSVQTNDGGIISVSGNAETGFYITATAGDPGNQHGIEIILNDNSKINITVATHTHYFTITADGNKVSASCGNTHCAYGNSTYNATLNASDVTYDGYAHGATLTKDSGFPAATDIIVSDTRYTGTTYGGAAYDSTSAPTQAGEYTATKTFRADKEGASSVSISTSFKILKANPTWTSPKAVLGMVYNKTAQTLISAGSAAGGTMKYDVVASSTPDQTIPESQYGTALPSRVNAGTYYVQYKVFGDANHNDSAAYIVAVTIAQKPVKVTGITARDKTYDGTRTAALVTTGASFSGLIEGDVLSISTTTGTFDTKKVGTNKTVSFNIALGGASAGNYCVASNSDFDTTASISQKRLRIYWENAGDNAYTGEIILPSASLRRSSTLVADDGLAYTGDDVEIVVAQKENGKERPSKNVGKGYEAEIVEFKGDDSDNYTIWPGYEEAVYNIKEGLVIVNWDQESLVKVYNGDTQHPDFTDNAELIGIKPADVDKVKVRIVEAAVKDTGIYKMTAELYVTDEAYAGLLNDYELDSSKETWFEITKAPLTVSAAGWIYYGEEVHSNADIRDLGYANVQGLKGDDTTAVLTGTVRYETNYNFLDDATGVNGAHYYLVPHFEQARNYEVTNADGELTVYPKPVTLAWTHTHMGESEDVSGAQIFTYDGKKHTYTAEVTKDSYVIVKGKQIDDDITITLAGNIQRDANVKTGITPYTAYAAELSDPNYSLQYVAENENRKHYNIATRGVDFIINQLPIELSWKPAEFTYNAQNQRPTATIENLQTDDNGDKDPAFEVVFTPEESINADNYTATVTDLADKNYSELAKPTDPESALVPTGTFAYTIKKAPLSIKSIAKTITYRDEAPKASEYELDVAGAGLQGDDTIENIGLNTSSLEFSCSYRKNDKPGSYAVVPSMDAQTLVNYTVNLEDGTLQVNDKSLGLVARGLAKGKKKGALAWNGVTGATSYEVWMAPCSSKSFKRVATVGGTSYVTKKLKKNKFYKFYIVANTPYGRIYSSQSHFCTGNKAKKLTNAKSLKINAGSVGLNKGDSFTIGKSAKKAKKKLKFPGAKHGGNFRFMSDNPEVATVNGAGTITAVGSGWCRVYTQTTNGIWQVTEVYVY